MSPTAEDVTLLTFETATLAAMFAKAAAWCHEHPGAILYAVNYTVEELDDRTVHVLHAAGLPTL
ncbi:hypothetical protein [Alloactinosynnema sp. L-07]|uniref:hypothetical protein n=1 Tax=Alloactinosynnema sp. L-07 TaxID=1653480 RepID=UPI00065EF7A2|nr:hypothetical protein [Alloactinosynnema sp. L-07]CRK56879.1 hypothetical protein [Alloactinosynnema sp. L-07]